VPRRLPLLVGLALCGAAHAATPPAAELTATAAWKGWTRPGRATEVDVRVAAPAALPATLEVAAGRRTARVRIDTPAAAPLRLHVPVGAADGVSLQLQLANGTTERRELRLSRSESPILAVALAAGGAARLDGFHSIAVGAEDLPRNASAYAAIDALLLDAPTLEALDARQLAALLARAAACDRIVVVELERAAKRLLEGTAGCNGAPLTSAATPAEALQWLRSSLDTPQPRPMAFAGIGELARPDPAPWAQVAALLGVYGAFAALALIVRAAWPVATLAPVLGSLAALAWMQMAQPPSRMAVWSEAVSGARSAQYQAWQRFTGVQREHLRVPLPPQLAGGAQPCDATQSTLFDLDPRSGLALAAEFDLRLFGQASLCYSGSFPMARAFAVDEPGAGPRQVRNVGASAWPSGHWLAEGLSHALPALAPGVAHELPAGSGRPPGDSAQRLAATRIPNGGAAALWALDLRGVTGIPIDRQGWLLVTAAKP
jgi:hypothetical protein